MTTTKVTYKTTKTGERVVCGPAATVRAGYQVLVDPGNGRLQPERPVRVGRTFVVNGQEMVYGYLGQSASRPAPTRRRNAAPPRARYGGTYGPNPTTAACPACIDVEDMGDGNGCSRHRGNPR